MINRSSFMAHDRDVNRAILQLIAESEAPIGQSTLGLILRRQGFTISVPTIGRRLQELEFEGLLRKVGVGGRVITTRGRKVLEQWQAEARLRTSSNTLVDTLRRGDKKHILDLLSARRIIERETVALAAKHASSELIRRLGKLLEQQSLSVGAGELGIREDASFHREIARASGNEVLHSLVSLLRSHERYGLIVASMRSVVGTSLVEDHKAVVDAIKARDPQRAMEAMDEHLRKLMDDIDRYWHRYIGGDSKKRR